MSYPKREILNDQTTESVAVGTGETITIPVADEAWKVKGIDLSPGANSTVTQVAIDGQNTDLTSDSNDIESEFGEMPMTQKQIVVTIDNSGSSAEDTTVTIKGVRYK